MDKAKMLKDFACRAGVTLVYLDPKEYGGHLGYRDKDSPNCVVGGFKTENAAYTHWLQSTFGKFAALAVLNLMRRVRGGANNA